MFATGMVYFDLEGIERPAFGLEQDTNIGIIQLAGPVLYGEQTEEEGCRPQQYRFVILLRKMLADSLDYYVICNFLRYLFSPERNIYWIGVGVVNDLHRLSRFFGLPDLQDQLVEATALWHGVSLMVSRSLLDLPPSAEWVDHPLHDSEARGG